MEPVEVREPDEPFLLALGLVQVAAEHELGPRERVLRRTREPDPDVGRVLREAVHAFRKSPSIRVSRSQTQALPDRGVIPLSGD